MKLQINKELLLGALEKVSKPLSSTPTKEALKGIKILTDKENGFIKLTTSDGILSNETKLQTNENFTIENGGEILIDGKTFINVIKKQAKDIVIEVKGEVLTIKSKGSNVKINLFEINSYPQISFELEEVNNSFTISDKVWKNIMNEVSYAAADNDKRIMFNGINIKSNDNGTITLSATDTFRLSTKTIKVDELKGEFNLIVLAKNLKTLLPTKMIGKIEFFIDENKILVKNENTISQSRLIDGIYPEIEKVIPQGLEKELTIETKELKNVIEKACVIESENYRAIKLEVKDNELIVASKNSQIGNATSKTNKFESNIKEFEIHLDSLFIKQTLSIVGNKAKLLFNDAETPVIIKDENNQGLTQLVLPQRAG